MRVDPAFQELYREEFPAVFRAAHALCGDRALAEDAAQEAFARALERWSRLRDRPWAAGWVVTTALNVARRALRRRPDAPADARVQVEPDDRLDLVRAIRRLPRRQQEAVVLRYVTDLPVAEVARAMGVEEGTVKSHLARARAALARELGGERIDG
ncbi:MAG: sigma-70 family RNA polymerase sigma factor [Actinobacteria bacterium]|nr:sigma-70 family RNA polymerase sigma factor [Actinomycetota bacterium]